MDEFSTFVFPILSGVIVSLVTLWLAGRQHTKRERQVEERRRQAILAAIGCELRWNRTATRGEEILDTGNAHYMIGKLSTVAFEQHGADMAVIAPASVEIVFEHYSIVGKVREGIRAIAGSPDRESNEMLRRQWVRLSKQARVDVSNSATAALKSLGLPIE